MMVLPMSFMQVKSALAAKERLEKTRAEDMERLSKQNKQKEEKLAKLLQETEARHSEFNCNLSRSLSLLDDTNHGIAPMWTMHVHDRSGVAPYAILLCQHNRNLNESNGVYFLT